MVIGYEINHEKRYCIKYSDSIIIGAYEVMFNEKSSFIYTAMTNVEGFFIRKFKWDTLRQDHEEISNYIKRNILMDYMINIRLKVIVNKKKAI